jgi:hypothetical protein
MTHEDTPGTSLAGAARKLIDASLHCLMAPEARGRGAQTAELATVVRRLHLGRTEPIAAGSAFRSCDHHHVKSDLERLSDEYELAESAFMDAVRAEADRGSLAAAARAVANAASQFNAEAYKSLHSGVEDAWMPLDHLTERTEILAKLWLDLATAYEG